MPFSTLNPDNSHTVGENLNDKDIIVEEHLSQFSVSTVNFEYS